MMSDVVTNTVRFVFLVILQVLILNNIQLSGYLNPFLYILFILMLPFQTQKWLVLILSFITGLAIDIFSDTGGLHAASSVFMGFLRTPVLQLISPREDYAATSQPTIQQFGFSWFFSYAGILTFAHHFFLFYLETFYFSEFFRTFLKVILSSGFTLMLIFVSQFFFTRPRT